MKNYGLVAKVLAVLLAIMPFSKVYHRDTDQRHNKFNQDIAVENLHDNI